MANKINVDISFSTDNKFLFVDGEMYSIDNDKSYINGDEIGFVYTKIEFTIDGTKVKMPKIDMTKCKTYKAEEIE